MHGLVKLAILLLIALPSLGLASEKPTYKTKENWITRFLERGGSLQKITGLSRDPDWKKHAHFVNLKTDEQLPAAYDWREKIPGGLQPIKNQGSCGSCWAFSVTASVEGALKIKDPASSPNLSEQTLVDCSQYDCGGGNFDAFDYIKEKGLASTADYSYRARNGRCKVTDAMQKQKIASWAYVGSEDNGPTTEQIKAAIYQYGVVSVDVSASGGFMGYSSGVYNGCNSGGINHMVDLVGWNDADGGYWIMRNSWGTDWGEDGYMRIRYTSKSGRKCNQIGDSAAFVVLE